MNEIHVATTVLLACLAVGGWSAAIIEGKKARQATIRRLREHLEVGPYLADALRASIELVRRSGTSEEVLLDAQRKLDSLLASLASMRQQLRDLGETP